MALSMSELSNVFAHNLRILRDARGWKQHHLAEASGLSLETIKKLETKTAFVSRESVTAIARALGVPETRLFLDPGHIMEPTAVEALHVIQREISRAMPTSPLRRRFFDVFTTLDDDQVSYLLTIANQLAAGETSLENPKKAKKTSQLR